MPTTAIPAVALTRRFGVRAKLLLAFAGMAGMTVAASAVGLFSFTAVETPMERIASTSLPEMELATRLSGESGRIATAAPALDAADTQPERERIHAENQERARAFLALVDELAARRPNDPPLIEVRNTGNALIRTLDGENEAVARRLSVRARRETVTGTLAGRYDSFLKTLAPLVEKAGEDLRAKGDALDEGTGRNMRGLSDAVRAMIALYDLRSGITSALDAVNQAAVGDVAVIDASQQAFLETSSQISGALGAVGDRLSADTGTRIDALFLSGYGKGNLFDLRRLTLDSNGAGGVGGADGVVGAGGSAIAGLNGGLATLRSGAAELLDGLQTPLRKVQSDIKRSNFLIRSQVQDAVQDLLGRGLERFRAHLELSTQASALTGALNEAAQAPDAGRLAVLETRFGETAVTLDERMAKLSADGGEDMKAMAASVDALIAFGRGEDGLFALRRAELAATADAERILSENRSLAQRFATTVDRQIGIMKAEAASAVAGSGGIIAAGRRMLILFAMGSLIGAVALAWFVVGRHIVGRLGRLSATMQEIATGNLDTAIPTAGSDEIGDMTRALIVFRDTANNARAANARAEAERGRAADERRRAMIGMAENFETGVRLILDRVSQAAGEMQKLAERMSGSADRTAGEASTAAGSSQQAEGNVKAVATATEELSASIQEIGGQVTASNQIARKAAEEAERTDRTVKGLSQAANKIGEVVGLIQSIAGRTNLLALNATIEAARAGEAGKGFAVVASEVKNLANQTAKATEEISGQITAMQAVTQEAVNAIRSIAGTIHEVNEIAAIIAAAVEQQGVATREIARNVIEAADSTRHVRSRIDSAAEAARESGDSANRVLSASSVVQEELRMLAGQVDALVGEMRTA